MTYFSVHHRKYPIIILFHHDFLLALITSCIGKNRQYQPHFLDEYPNLEKKNLSLASCH